MAALSEEQILAINAIRGILAVRYVSPIYHVDTIGFYNFHNLSERELSEIEAELFNYLCLGISFFDLNLVQLAIKAGCTISKHPEVIDQIHESIFMIRNNSEIFISIIVDLGDAGADLNIQNESGKSLLHYACHVCSPEIVKLLIARKAEINVRDDCDRTPLMIAARNVDLDSVQLLLEAGADPWLRDCDLCNALYHAKMHSPCAPSALSVVELIAASPKRKRNILYCLNLARKWIIFHLAGELLWIKNLRLRRLRV